MLYPESQHKIYSGKLISVEMELEKIQDRIEMSSFILLATAVITFLYLIFQLLEYGFVLKDNVITILTILLFFALWRFSFKYPLISFIIGFIIYMSNLIVYFQNSNAESLNIISYRLVVPVILLIGIFNIIYSWFQVREIKKKEALYPENVQNLIYVVKERFIYNDSKYYDDVIANIDFLEGYKNLTLVTLKNQEKYFNYAIEHHAYQKYCQLFVQQPTSEPETLVKEMINSSLKINSNIFLSILVNIFDDQLEWIDYFITLSDKKISKNIDLADNAYYLTERIKASISDSKYKSKIVNFQKRLKAYNKL